MKAKALQLGRALNAALFVLLLSVAGTKNAFAQQTLVATLQHGENLSIFYGMNAFVEAHAAAETGDIITLSSGSFTPTTITKAITLHGAGFVTDTVSGTTPTVFSAAISANVDDEVNYLTIEGIRFTSDFKYGKLYNPHFYKCYFGSFYNTGNTNTSHMENAQFINCRVNHFYVTSSNSVYALNTSFINSMVWDLGNYGNSYYGIWANSIVAINCFVRLAKSASAMNAVNSIVTPVSTTYFGYLTGSSFATYCIGIKPTSSSSNPLGSSNTGCWVYTGVESVFESYTGGVSDTDPLLLKEEIANTCLGTDGMQVGIHGGVMPYTDRPAYMVIKHCSVANQTDTDNKLGVEIEVLNDGE